MTDQNLTILCHLLSILSLIVVILVLRSNVGVLTECSVGTILGMGLFYAILNRYNGAIIILHHTCT